MGMAQGADYSFSVVPGTCTAPNTTSMKKAFMVTKGADVATYRYSAVSSTSSYQTDAYMLDKLKASTNSYKGSSISGSFKTLEAYYTIALIGNDADGNIIPETYCSFRFFNSETKNIFYSILDSYEEASTSAKQSFGFSKKGFDIAYYKAAVASKSADAKTAAQSSEKLYGDTFTLDISNVGYNYVYIYAYNDAGEEVGTANYTLYYRKSTSWKEYGLCYFTDDILTKAYKDVNPETLLVEVQKCSFTDGSCIYRMKNPYKGNSTKAATKFDRFIYLSVDADNNVTFVPSVNYTGVETSKGELRITLVDASNPGKFADGKITFPKDGVKYQYYSKADGKLYASAANANGAFCLDLNPINVVKIQASGYSTFCSSADLAVPSGLTAWYASSCDGSAVTLKQIEDGKIPALTGVVLKGEASKTYTLSACTDAETVSGNLLVGVVEETMVDPTTPNGNVNYVLNDGMFYTFTGQATVPAGKAYLSVMSSGTPLDLQFGDATTIGIVENGLQTVGKVYNLNGQAVGNDYKGFVIKNGKKFFNK